MKAAIYARVSTKIQEYQMQLTELRSYAKRMDWAVIEEYVEKASSVKKRPQLDRMMEDARLRKFDVVLVWKLDRFARSMRQFLDLVLRLDSYGVRFIAVTQNLDTDERNPMGKLMMHIIAAFAEFERAVIVERVQAGVDEAKLQGKHCGRPPKIFRRDEALRMRQLGLSWSAIARKLGVKRSTVRDGVRKVSDVVE